MKRLPHMRLYALTTPQGLIKLSIGAVQRPTASPRVEDAYTYGKQRLTLCSAMYNATSFQLLLCMLNLRWHNGLALFVIGPESKEVGDPVEQTTSYETNGVSKVFREDRATDSNCERCDCRPIDQRS